MVDNIDTSFLQKRLEDQQRKNERLGAEIERMSSKSGGGGGGPGDLLDYRVTKLEESLGRIEEKLSGIGDIRVLLAVIDERLKATATSVQVEYLKGRVEGLPSTWQTIAIMVSLVGAMAAIAYGALHFAGH